MRIAILGTRGIPNNYGGFEQFAEYLSKGLVEMGHEVWVYSGDDHVYQEKTWEGVNIIHKKNPEDKIGTAGQFIYDFFCVMDSRKRRFDIILQLGYTSNSVWGRLLPGRPVIITNMDGLEWKRSKFSAKVRRFLKYAEKLAVKTSDFLIADSIGIQSYLKSTYNKHAEYIPYGTNVALSPDIKVLADFAVQPYQYNMLIARMEPENNIETILNGVVASNESSPMLVIGNVTNAFGKYLVSKFERESRIKFLGPNYDIHALNSLRYFSNVYFHGHSVGGTNPSLLEAMGSGALICAHQNEFNSAILGTDAFYFTDATSVAELLNKKIDKQTHTAFVESNLKKIDRYYRWPLIINAYEAFFRKVAKSK